MTRRTDWARLEPRPRSDDTRHGLRAEVHDPLWLLGRQWQFGERQGEDGGSPVRASLTVAEDRLRRVELRGGDPGEPFDYEDEPLEAVVERERVLTDDDPPMQERVEAGQQFCRILASEGYGEYAAAQFPPEFRVEAPEAPLNAADRRYVDLLSDRALDGTALARAIRRAVDNIDDVVAGDADSWRGVSGGELPVPDGGSRTDAFDVATERFYGWYVDLYEEPTVETGSAWDPARLAYEFAVSTGAGETETVFEASEYRGGHLDWYAFDSADAEATLDETADAETVSVPESDITDTADDGLTLSELDEAGLLGATATRSKEVVPTRLSFPGMPASRFWEFEGGEVDVTKLSGDGSGLARLALAEFALLYGNEWFQIDLDTPVGTLTRITDLTVTDSFGVTERAQPAVSEDPQRWQMYAHELPGHDEPGLFLPPTLQQSTTGDPVGEVTFARDEMANLAFAIERSFESPTGRAVDRTEFRPPELVIDRVVTATDPDEEYVELANPGQDSLVADGYTVSVETDGETRALHQFGTLELGPGETIRLYSGTPADEHGAGESSAVWNAADADAVVVETERGDVTAKRLLSRPGSELADYRLSTDVPEYWFPFTPEQGWYLVLERALLLDADTLGLDPDELPRPRGEILRPGADLLGPGGTYQVYDEELPGGGREVSRRYQYARWTDGEGYLWSTRRSRVGDTQLATGLRFDVLDDSGP